MNSIPGPRPTPILGWRGNAMQYFRNPIARLSYLYRTYGSVVCLVQGGNKPLFFRPGPNKTPTIFAFGAENNRQILTQPNIFESDFLRAPEKCGWLCDNMVATNREERARHRRMIMPAFTKDHLKAYYNDTVALTKKMLDGWQAGQQLDVQEEMEEYAANIASKIFYGQDPQEHHLNLARIAQGLARAMFSPITMIPIDLPGSPYRKFLRRAEQAGEILWSEIERRRTAGADGKDALSMMIKAHDEGEGGLSRTQLIGNAFGLFLAGHEAPASAFSLTLFLLAQHPAIMAELMLELDDNLHGEPPSFEEIWKLPVLDRIMRESLRLLCPSVLLWRRLTAASKLGPYEIPVGSEVLLSPYITHVDPAIYSQPRKYRPSRWLEKKASPFEYLPFSYGARKCLGAAFGEMLLKILISMVVQRFRLQVIPDTRIDFTVTFSLRPKPGLPMVVHPQDRNFQSSRAGVRGYINEMVDFD